MRSCIAPVVSVFREVGRNRRSVAISHRFCSSVVSNSDGKTKAKQFDDKKNLHPATSKGQSKQSKTPVSIAEEKRTVIRNTIRTSYMFKIPDTLLQSYDDAVYDCNISHYALNFA